MSDIVRDGVADCRGVAAASALRDLWRQRSC